MASALQYITEGTRIFFTSWKARLFKKKYPGNAKKICKKIVKDCWNGRYFQTSTGNFSQFWTRDFFWVTKSLLDLGYQQEVQKTLRYAMNRFRQANKITTSLTPRGKAYDFPTYSVDSLPNIIHSMKLAKFNYYDYKDFLNKEIRKFYDKVIDKKTGLVKGNEHFSSMKDYSVRKSSCYDNCMVALLAKDLKGMKLVNPFKKFNYAKLIKDNFWNGNYFFDDLSKKEYVAGDANLFPFIMGIIKDKEMMQKSMQSIAEAELDCPFPLKYTNSRAEINFIWEEFFLKNYESDAIWTHMGPLYIKFLEHVDKEKASRLKKKYTELIEKHNNYLEVFTKDGKPFSTPFYYCDSGMLWAANYLTL
tara:strand:- start:902 stop:1984 length:1083 start_codon:yes stop_codon:yes gene_type:complete